jgi:hypothetical protein
MATTTYKVLGQVAPSATTETDLYTVPAATQAITSTIVVANRAASPATFRVSVSVAGGATENKDFLYYDVFLNANTTGAFTLGVTLGATDKIRVYASTADLSFNVYGTEIA